MKVTFKQYEKEMNKLLESKKFKKLDIDEKLLALLELASKFKITKH